VARDEFVSIHAPARGATPSPRQTSRSLQGFNPRPCARGDLTAPVIKTLPLVSIHAPARGATQNAIASGISGQFQSTPLREGRRNQYHISCRLSCFNPRPCARGDEFPEIDPLNDDVSIHAPARGATQCNHYPNIKNKFQSTPLREGRLIT